MNNFSSRAITGALFVIVLIGCTVFNVYTLAGLFFVVTLLGLREYYALASINNNHPQSVAGTIIGMVLYSVNILYCLGKIELKFFFILIPLLFFLFITELFLKNPSPFRNIAYTILGIMYVALPFSFIISIGTQNSSHEYLYHRILGIYFIIWASDTGAYLVGSKLGKTKLMERISPGKTWEGSIGGAVLAFITAYFISVSFAGMLLNTADWFVIAFILVVMGTLGDLTESMLKRAKGVKDSGSILPGHGGILDRFDSLILSLPFIWFYLMVKG